MKILIDLFKEADIEVNGTRPWDMKINNPRVWHRIMSDWSLGLGESYMDGDWDCDRLDIFFEKIFSADLDQNVQGLAKLKLAIFQIKSKILNLQSVKRAFQVGEHHYDLGNDLYEKMLDPYMQYSCAYWGNGAKNLNEAQEHKLEMICKKLQLKPGDNVLEIGCGWGSLSRYAVKNYNVNWAGLTVSKEQKNCAEKISKDENLNRPPSSSRRSRRSRTSSRSTSASRSRVRSSPSTTVTKN